MAPVVRGAMELVGWLVVIKNLNVGAELEFHVGVIGRRRPSDDGKGAEGRGDAIRGSELVSRAGDEAEGLVNQKTREALERKALGESAQVGFDGAV